MYHGYIGKLETTTTQQYVTDTGEWHTVITERWNCHKDEEAALIASFKVGRNGYMMGSPPQTEPKGEMREITATFGPARDPQRIEWYTSQRTGLILNRREVVPIEDTAAIAAAATQYIGDLPGNGMQCTPTPGSSLTVCTSSWGPPEDEDASLDDKQAGSGETVDGTTVSGAEAGVTPTVPCAIRLGWGSVDKDKWQYMASLFQEIIAGSIHKFPEDYPIHPNKYYRGKVYLPKDAEIIPELGAGQPAAKAAHEISQIRSLPYSSQRITINMRVFKEKKMETIEEILSKMKDVGKLYRTVNISSKAATGETGNSVRLEQPQVTSAMIKRYAGGSSEPGAGLCIVEHLWKFDGITAKTIGEGTWVRKKTGGTTPPKPETPEQPVTAGNTTTPEEETPKPPTEPQPEKTERKKKYKYEYSLSFSSVIVMYVKDVDPEIEINAAYSN